MPKSLNITTDLRLSIKAGVRETLRLSCHIDTKGRFYRKKNTSPGLHGDPGNNNPL